MHVTKLWLRALMSLILPPSTHKNIRLFHLNLIKRGIKLCSWQILRKKASSCIICLEKWALGFVELLLLLKRSAPSSSPQEREGTKLVSFTSSYLSISLHSLTIYLTIKLYVLHLDNFFHENFFLKLNHFNLINKN